MDWIDAFMAETEGIKVPEAFRRWTAITTIAGALERRVWTHTDRGILHPNFFTILAGSPASGKSLCVNTARALWVAVSGLHLGPDNPTKASFLDSLEAAVRIPNKGEMNGSIFCALSVACREFGVLIPKHDTSFLSDLTDIYDNPPLYTAPRRTVKSLEINKPTINIIAGVTPDFLNDIMPETAWGQGFTSRLMFIYGTREIVKDRDIFKKRKDVNMKKLSETLVEIFNETNGEFEWADDAQAAYNTWLNSGMEPVPNYGRLTHYVGRRETYILKLAMVSSISAQHGLHIKLSDYERAKSWLLSAEALMPDVFRAMAQKSDSQLIVDLHWHCYTQWSRVAREKRKPVTEKDMYNFLQDRIPSERIPRVIEVAIRSGHFVRATYPGEYIPRSLDTLEDVKT